MTKHFNSYDVLLLDIEGTICSISFVRDVLYPYFLNRFEHTLDLLAYPLTHIQNAVSDTDAINNIVSQFPDTETKAQVTDHIKHLVDNDIKDPVLKSFQGFVWKLGYEKGDLVAPIYPDAIRLIQQFSDSKRVYIYSSGSVKAQKLLFNYVKDGEQVVDMNKYLSGYYDITTSGYKTEPSSYTNILESIGFTETAAKVLFLSDNVKEVVAAKKAGMDAIIVDRPGNNPVSKEDVEQYGMISEFNY